MDDLVGDSHDNEFDSYTKQDGCGATNGAKVSGEDMKDADTSVEDPSDATTDVEHMDAIGNPEENEGSNEKEDPSDSATNEEHMDVVGNPDENEGTNAKEPISHVLNTPVDNEDVLMKNTHETINHADPPNHESEIMSPCGSKRKGDGLDGEKANQIILTYELNVLASKDTVKAEVSSKPKSLLLGLDKITAKYRKIKVVKKLKRAPSTSNRRQSKRHKHEDGKEIKLDPLIKGTGFAVEEIFWQCLVDKDANRKGWLNDQVYIPITIDNAHWFLAEFKIMTGVVTFYDTLCGLEPGQEENHDWWPSLRKMMIEQLPQGMSKHGIFNKKDIDPKRYNITFEFSNCAPIQAGLYGDYGVWVCIMIYRLANGLSMDFPLNPMLHPD
ncbi:phospholipase-like protein [Tanacetum coccineum]